VVLRLPVQWGDLDAYGHVNNAAYLKWFESARAEYALRVGVDVLPNQRGVGAIVGSLSCRFHRPLGYPADVLIGVRMVRVAVGKITLSCRIVEAQTGAPAADAECDAVLFDYAAGRPVAVPDAIRAAVEVLEGRAFPA